MHGFTWENTEDIALALLAKFPAQDPLRVRFTDLHRWVIELDGFDGNPAASSEGVLEAIQMVWYEEWLDAQN